jgi:hypothetical protein
MRENDYVDNEVLWEPLKILILHLSRPHCVS